MSDVLSSSKSKQLYNFIRNFSKSKIRIIKNFPITLVSKGIKLFAEKLNQSKTDKLKNFALENRIVVFFVQNLNKILDNDEVDQYMKEAEKYCLAEIYSYIVFTTLEYEIISIDEFLSRNFVQTLFAVCEISTCDSEYMMPIIYPKLLAYLENIPDSEQKELKETSVSLKRKYSVKSDSSSERVKK